MHTSRDPISVQVLSYDNNCIHYQCTWILHYIPHYSIFPLSSWGLVSLSWDSISALCCPCCIWFLPCNFALIKQGFYTTSLPLFGISAHHWDHKIATSLAISPSGDTKIHVDLAPNKAVLRSFLAMLHQCLRLWGWVWASYSWIYHNSNEWSGVKLKDYTHTTPCKNTWKNCTTRTRIYNTVINILTPPDPHITLCKIPCLFWPNHVS